MWDFKKLQCSADRKNSNTSFSGDKGHGTEMKILLDAFETGASSPINIDLLAATSRSTFAALESLRTGRVIRL
jgi:hypothetical protein